MGSSYNQNYVDSTKDTNLTNMKMNEDSTKSEVTVSMNQYNAIAIQSTEGSKEGMYATDSNERIQMRALDVREQEAELKFKVDWKSDENDALRAAAAQTSADADLMNAETKADKVSNNYELDLAKLDVNDGYSQFYA